MQRRAAVAALLAGSIPNLAQWFNLYVYATFAPYFRTEFFDPSDENSLVWVYGIFALTFVVRPLGSWVFGRLADARGRQLALVAAVTLMSLGSLALAFAPTYAQLGAGAAIVLVAVSLVQGLATGGEYAAATVLLSESGTTGRRGFFASFQSVTIIGGLVLAQAGLLLLLAVSDRAAVSTWGWRVAFAVAGLAGLATLWWARGVERAPRGRSAASGTLGALLRTHWRPALWVFLLTAGGTICFYTYTVTVPTIVRETFVTAHGDAGEVTATALVLVALVVLMLLQPLGGALSDRIGRKPLLVAFGIGGILVSAPLLAGLARIADAVPVLAMLIGGYAVLTCYQSVNGIAKAEVFPPEIRALGVGFGYAIANSLFGGTAPMAYHASIRAGGDTIFLVYLTALVAVTLGAAIVMRGGAATALDDAPVAASRG